MKVDVEHKGTISKVYDDAVTVSILPAADECGGCAIANMCSKGETIDIAIDRPSADLVGRRVVVGASSNLQRRATLLFFVAPMILLFVVLTFSLLLGFSEALCCIFSILSITIWYIILFTFRLKIQSKAVFKILRFID